MGYARTLGCELVIAKKRRKAEVATSEPKFSLFEFFESFANRMLENSMASCGSRSWRPPTRGVRFMTLLCFFFSVGRKFCAPRA